MPSLTINDILVSSDQDCNIIPHLLSMSIKPIEKCSKVENSPYSFLFPITTSIVRILWICHCIPFRVQLFTNFHSIVLFPLIFSLPFFHFFHICVWVLVISRLNLYTTVFCHFRNVSITNWSLKYLFYS